MGYIYPKSCNLQPMNTNSLSLLYVKTPSNFKGSQIEVV